MKTTALLLLILGFTFISNKSNCQTKTTKQFASYTITIPFGWKESSKAELQQFNEASNQRYDVMLYPDKKTEYNGPPIMLAVFKKKEMTKVEFESTANEILKTFKTNLHDFIPKEFSSDIKMLKLGQGYYNKKDSYFTYIYVK